MPVISSSNSSSESKSSDVEEIRVLAGTFSGDFWGIVYTYVSNLHALSQIKILHAVKTTIVKALTSISQGHVWSLAVLW